MITPTARLTLFFPIWTPLYFHLPERWLAISLSCCGVSDTLPVGSGRRLNHNLQEYLGIHAWRS
ncbi:hypothetical protein TRIATDRAFT_297686 [Trichoderma atroviride IMI 206040]|uniref:Uncharacterized protein n=1 Tax=Hypocrea atroviridis (strain ATCC 20476 / IMI 206040) TaxID=452589 RepID=G9NJ48_HYPAI|nr:uncharacterized protein TRIATDRAFT_297686 [Trichoderma atroviride IMI 206040]EHK48922.1 hypothetical protein TRIATDRAFT_297686 [Trichoderma atroviride IMI 206040]